MLFLHYVLNKTTYCMLRVIKNANGDTAGNLWHTGNENFDTSFDGTTDNFDIGLTEDIGGGNRSGFYSADIPTNLPAGTYIQENYNQAGGTADVTADYFISSEIISINSSGERQESYTPSSPGYNTHTLTIRTTGGSAVDSGVKVWLNTSNTSSATVTPIQYTDSSGQVTFDLSYNTYHVFCASDDYSFTYSGSDNEFTSSSGSTTFNIDIATAVSTSPDTSGYSEAFLNRMIVSIRRYTDEPATDKKYTDNNLVDEIEKSYPLILGEINRNKQQNHIVATYNVPISSNTIQYVLPPDIGKVMSIYDEDDWGGRTFYFTSGQFNPQGRGVWIVGGILNVQKNLISSGTELTVEYIPSNTARLHNGICTVDADGDTVTLAENPNLGELDTRPHAYIGSVLRILSADTYGYIQERTITAYNNENRAATLEKALSPIPSGSIIYEICPPIHRGLDDVVASRVARDILLTEGSTQRANAAANVLTDRLRNLRLDAYYSNVSQASQWNHESYRNSRRGRRRVR